tara:strand:- start:1214 stop:2212 length:999 start_codon:yes stop_codon:yes gene_type:complete
MPEQASQAAPAAADPISIIQGQLDREMGVQAAPAQQEPEVTEAPQPETEVEEAQPNQQVEGEEAPSDAKVAEIPLDQLEAIQLEVEVSGESGKVTEKPTIKELKLGYMRQRDYQKKTEEVSRQRNEVGEKIRQGIESERASYQQTLQQLQTAVIESVAPELKDVNWNHLAANDPFEYVKLRNRAEQITNLLTGIQSKQKEVTEKQTAEQRQAMTKAAQQSREQLERDIPSWDDGLYQKLMKTGTDYGYKPDEVGSWVDPRAFKVLHDAYQFRQLKAEKPLVGNKVVNVPKVLKPGATTTASASQRNTEAAMGKLQKSGRIEDAAALIRARMR